ncbi:MULTISPECIES: M1 family metallopeptidase [Methanoculleus]|uniref:Peptidase M1, membrane alanine aminopeptidase n=2 Tax=Methanoculleus TaxID=45989 RepID=A3CXL6_METMJ|nr:MULTISPECIES: M1 family metallopeptidase [Methanoculleus]ABN58116.1 peptidase M1, membrane alanine aminopeptidase [Methanoculleus marisnigri JR1]UYU19498.1 M1 family metallopeptidase [Methanoculleus submarinus]
MTGRESGERRLFRYYPEDFGALPVRVVHMDLVFDVYDGHTRVVSALTAETFDAPLASLALNARDLDILRVESAGYTVTHTYDRDAALLTVAFDPPVPPRTRFTLDTETICRPSSHVLEGLYYDGFYPGGPPTQITQCQQWGFQRLVPCLDDMTAKCTYTTTIVADSGYTNTISNGDPAGPRIPCAPGRSVQRYENTRTPMAPYLFFLGVGCYDTYRREFEYPDGRTFFLELLAKPGSDATAAERALEILADAVMWIHLFTGQAQYRDRETREEVWRLVRVRDEAKRSGDLEALEETRKTLKDLISTITPGYAYTGAVYREIAMQNSDFGGMENVGNTTIAANRIIPGPDTTDPALEYLVRVKVHEYYHNENGSEVTGWSPFEIWLNEAVTVHVENQHHAFLFGEAYSRLKTVLELLDPADGTLTLDRGAGSMPIEPDGFNDPNDLITGVTYVKAPEFVRMIETLMGKEAFAEALGRYHDRFRHANASRTDWIRCMEEVSGQDFTGMAAVWLKEKEYPVLTVTSSYDPGERRFTLAYSQNRSPGGRLREFPFRFALVDADGRDIRETTARIADEAGEIVLDGVDRPAFLSLNRGCSFYGKTAYQPPEDELYLQVGKDPDVVGRFTAFLALADREMLRLLEEPDAAVSDRFADLCAALLADDALMEEAGGQFLTIFPSVEDERFAHRYRTLHDARQTIYAAVAARGGETLLRIYRQAAKDAPAASGNLEEEAAAIRQRQRKNACLSILATRDTPEVHRLLLRQFREATAATDRLTAFSLILESSAPERQEILESFAAESARSPGAWESFLAAVAGSDCDDLVPILQRIESSPAFAFEQADQQRALYGRFALNRKRSLETEEGRAYLAEVLRRLAPVNEYSAVRALDAFAFIDGMEPRHRVPAVAVLADLLSTLDPGAHPAIYNNARRFLLGAPKAVRAYETEHGAIPALGGSNS